MVSLVPKSVPDGTRCASQGSLNISIWRLFPPIRRSKAMDKHPAVYIG